MTVETERNAPKLLDQAPGSAGSAGSPGSAQQDPGARLYVAMGRLIRVLRREGVPGLDTPQPGPGSFSALVTLVRSGPMRLGDLAAREAVAPPTLSRIVAALEDGGYVVRHPDPDDRRAVQVAATASGQGLVNGVGEARVAALSSRLAALPEPDRAALLAALPALEALAADGA